MIRITRVEREKDLLRGYKIFIDDVYRGEIISGETIDFEVENGSHTVYAKISVCSSKELCVDVNDSIVELELNCILTWQKELLSPLKSLSYYYSRRDEYLTLKVKDPDAEEEIAAIDRLTQWLQGMRLPRFWKSKKSDEDEE